MKKLFAIALFAVLAGTASAQTKKDDVQIPFVLDHANNDVSKQVAELALFLLDGTEGYTVVDKDHPHPVFLYVDVTCLVNQDWVTCDFTTTTIYKSPATPDTTLFGFSSGHLIIDSSVGNMAKHLVNNFKSDRDEQLADIVRVDATYKTLTKTAARASY
jgi:hypothetical protein